MRKSTELMESILTSSTAQKIIDYVAPVYGEAYVVLWLFQVIGAALDDINNFPDEFMTQVTPATATWTIEFWEREYGVLPDPSLSLDQRRKNILNKIKSKMRMNPQNIREILQNKAGADVEILENTGKNRFNVRVYGFVETAIKNDMINFLNEIKPAHLIFDFNESDYLQSIISLYNDLCFTEQESCDITIRN